MSEIFLSGYKQQTDRQTKKERNKRMLSLTPYTVFYKGTMVKLGVQAS